MYRGAEGVVACPKCNSVNVLHYAGVGNEAHFRCEECYIEYRVSIHDGYFSIRISSEL